MSSPSLESPFENLAIDSEALRPSAQSAKAHSDPALPTVSVEERLPANALVDQPLVSASPAPKARDFAIPIASTSSLDRPPVAVRTGSAPVLPQAGSIALNGPARGGLGSLRARGGGSSRNVPIPPSLQARVAAGLQNRNKAEAANAATHLSATERIDATAILNAASNAPQLPGFVARSSTPQIAVPGRQMPGGPMGGLAARRKNIPGLSLGGIPTDEYAPVSSAAPSGRITANGPTGQPPIAAPAPRRRGPPGGLGLNLGGAGRASSPFSNFNKIVDPSGRLTFENKAVVHAGGVDFSNGASFSIKMDDLTLQEELGHGNYGTVQKVLHKRTNVIMAMKEIRLELDESKLKSIITELDILHRATAPEIIEFYGAFFIESCVYYCMEYMDAGSLEGLQGDIPEPVLARVTGCMVRGLRFLKDELQTMHRDVKPTNVLVNRKGEIKLCDFGVSTQLEKSLAKTAIGCQTYMAPERIKGESVGAVSTYTVAADVWSLGLLIIEFVLGHYPYPPETYSNVFAQLQAIVHGDPPGLPDGYSPEANHFVSACLTKDANKRPSYAKLQAHPFLVADQTREVDMVKWVEEA